jgi:hypothetical protein
MNKTISCNDVNAGGIDHGNKAKTSGSVKNGNSRLNKDSNGKNSNGNVVLAVLNKAKVNGKATVNVKNIDINKANGKISNGNDENDENVGGIDHESNGSNGNVKNINMNMNMNTAKVNVKNKNINKANGKNSNGNDENVVGIDLFNNL